MSFLFRRRAPGSRHVYRYGPLRIACVDRDVPIDVRVNARLMYKAVLSWEDKARCATPFDMIARDLGEFWLLDQWFTVGLHGWTRAPIDYGSSSTIRRLFTSASFHAAHARRPRYVRLLDEHRLALLAKLSPAVARLDRGLLDRLGSDAAAYRASLADWIFSPYHAMLLSDVPGCGAWQVAPFAPEGWRRQLGIPD